MLIVILKLLLSTKYRIEYNGLGYKILMKKPIYEDSL